MKKDHTHIAIVLDRSGSMSSCADDTKGGFDTFVADQKKAVGTATLTLAQFDNEYEVIHSAKNIQEVPPLVFIPRGGTALLDAIGKTIATTGEALAALPEDERPERVAFVIITDGHENASKEFKREKIMEMIKHQTENYKWEFVFLGANQDAIQAGASMGIHGMNSMTYDAKNTGQAYVSMSSNMRSMRSRATATMSFSAEDRRKNQPKG